MVEEERWCEALFLDPELVTGTLDQMGYHSILQSHALPSGQRLVGQGFILHQDNDVKRTSRLCQNCLRRKEQDSSFKSWPAQLQSWFGRNWTKG